MKTRHACWHSLIPLAGLMLQPLLIAAAPGAATVQTQPAAAPPDVQQAPARDLFVTMGKSLVVDSPVNIQRVVVGNGELAEAIAVNPREVLVNGKLTGETSLIIWQQGGARLFFDLYVRPSTSKLEAIRQQVKKELTDQDVTVTVDNDTAFVRGTVKDVVSGERAVAIASTLGKTVNLLNVTVPPVEAQVLLRVRFADVDRSTSLELAANLFSTGATNTLGTATTGQYQAAKVIPGVGGASSTLTLGDALNLFLFRPDLNLGLVVKALQTRGLLQILAEPNVLAINGKPASFLAGGEYPYPTLQGGGAGLGAVTIQFREFGVRLNFLPTITPRGTIRLQVTPEVSSLDFANALVFQGFSIPALATRRIQTEIELESGQSFAIAGLLDNRLTETFDRIPGLASIPILGNLFKSRSSTRSNSELLVIVTPELVRPIPAGQPVPQLQMPKDIAHQYGATLPRTPGMDVTGPVAVVSQKTTIPMEELVQSQKALQGPQNSPSLQANPYNPSAPTWPAATPLPAPGPLPQPQSAPPQAPSK